MQMRKIEIDFDIHQIIEAERRGFSEPEYVVLRRLLKLPEPEENAATENVAETGIPFVEDGVSIPHGSEARMLYQHGRQQYEGRFLNGKLLVNAQSFSSLSAAASSVAVKKDGGKTNLNGWLYWETKFPGRSDWVKLSKLRDDLKN
ncbi:MAG: hypothetical protein GY748_20540 [Planctomycetaceae bacterium]|nr:hypothetical protein [Planctomycetaceae bacterium]